MTDAVNNNNENNFSFRMFDLYRRFVELLRLNPDFLTEFKSGYPKEEICRDMIQRIYQHRQNEDRILPLLKYLNRNAKTIANHAENIPNNWTDAIKYTNQCIKLIRKYFRTYGIDIKKDFNVDEVTEGIGEYLYDIPNKVQLEAIRDYLIHDLRNPKKTIIPQQASTKSKIKSKKSSKEPTDLNPNDSIEIAMEVIFNDSLKTGNNDDYQNLLGQKSAEIARLLKENNAKSQNELLHIGDDTKSSLEESYQSVIRVEDSSNEDEDVEIEIESPEYERLEINNENLTDAMIESPHTSKGLKRSSVENSDHESSIKKICTQKDCYEYELSMDQYQPVIRSKDDESEDEKVRTSISDSSESQSTLENVEANTSPINSKEDLLNILEDVKVKTEEEIISLNFDKQTLTITENSSSNSEQNYLNPLSMTYHDAYKLMESIMAFCAFKNETSIEEFLILRRTRDKMLWRSLKETKSKNLSKN